MEAGKSRLAGDTKRNADATEVKDMRNSIEQFKLLVAELSLENRKLKKSLHGLGEES
jgi:transposase